MKNKNFLCKERRRKWQPTPVFLPREFHGQRNLAGDLGSPGVRHDLATKLWDILELDNGEGCIAFTPLFYVLKVNFMVCELNLN